MPKKEIVIIGAGKIGRGYLAELFSNAGFHITFIVRRKEQADSLREAGQYLISRATEGEMGTEEVVISGYDVFCFADEWEACVNAIVHTNYVALPIYSAASETAGKLIAAAIEERAAQSIEEPLDVFLCVNYLEGNKMLRGHIEQNLQTEAGKAYYKKYVGIVETLVSRLAVDPTPELAAKDPNAVSAGFGMTLPCDADAFVGEVPEGAGIMLLEKLPARFVYKIWTTNMMHFGISLYGDHLGYSYVREAAADPYVIKCVRLAEREAVFAVAHDYDMTPEQVVAEFKRSDPWATWANPAANDGYERVVFDMRRKLAKADRVIGPALAVLRGGKVPYFLARIAALALMYFNPEDPTCVEIKQLLAKGGVALALQEFSDLSEDVETEKVLLQLIEEQYNELQARLV